MRAESAATMRTVDPYGREAGRAVVTGNQAIVRFLLEQRWLDEARGLKTGVFVSGYPGSPLGGLDSELQRVDELLRSTGIVFQPGLNEELAATAVAGTQLLGNVPKRTVDGIVGVWFGKNPGLDRAADAIRHGNVSGTSSLGGAVALIGDDPTCKSSTLPSSCELMARSLMMPLLSPSSIEEVIELGLHAVALSRESGLWVGLRLVADLVDGTSIAPTNASWDGIPEPSREQRGAPPILLAPESVAAEHDLISRRVAIASSYSSRHGLNRVVHEPPRPSVAIVAHGITFAFVQRGLSLLGLKASDLDDRGVRLIELRMPWPLGHDDLRLFDGVDSVLVIEDKVGFLESQLKDMLYSTPHAPGILGRTDAKGEILVPSRGAVTASSAATAIGKVLGLPPVSPGLGRRPNLPVVQSAARTAYFCSGCPHNLSTKASADQLVGGGIGCHALVSVAPVPDRGKVIGAPQMGGEGAHWIGLAPFTADEHLIQNLGDGTFHHSGSLAVRAAVAAQSNITFKILLNDAVAMTGGQPIVGRMSLDALSSSLLNEGVQRVAIVLPRGERIRRRKFDRRIEFAPRESMEDLQRRFSAVRGVTVIIYKDQCATERRRLRKRGLLAPAKHSVWINDRVCEGCGDCGAKSNCLSLHPVMTEFGRKTRVHQSSCNSDEACLSGDCPAFVLVKGAPARRDVPGPPDVPAPEPCRMPSGRDWIVRMPGVGGTGVVTVARTLQMAARLDGHTATGVDQTGLAQKGGVVVSDIRISKGEQPGATRAADSELDLMLCFDPIAGVGMDSLAACAASRTAVVANTGLLPTATMVSDVGSDPVDVASLIGVLREVSRADAFYTIDALALSEQLFGDHLQAHFIQLGFAIQKGLLPVSIASVEEAIRLTGAAAEANVQALRWGRAVAAMPSALGDAHMQPRSGSESARVAIDSALVGVDFPDGLKFVVQQCADELNAYHSSAYSRDFLQRVREFRIREVETSSESSTTHTETFARMLFKLMAYKDEYEVARLHILESQVRARESLFGQAPSRIMLRPPLLRAFGITRKIGVGPLGTRGLAALARARRLRGTRLDPFGYTAMRRLERQLPAEYTRVALAAVTDLAHDQVALAELLALPDMIRGYEEVKLRNVERYRVAVSVTMSRAVGGGS